MENNIDVTVVEENVIVQFLDSQTSLNVDFIENHIQVIQEVISVVVDPEVIDVTLSTQQGPAGPPGPQGPAGPPGSGVVVFWEPEALENLAVGSVVYCSNLGQAGLADPTVGTKEAVGVSVENTTAGMGARIQLSGICVLSGLTPGQEYWLRPGGVMATSPLTSAGVSFQRVGRALSATELLIEIENYGRKQ